MNPVGRVRAWLKKLVSRRMFLLRLVATTILAGLIPVLLLSMFYASRKSDEMQASMLRQADLVSASVCSQFENCMDSIQELNSQLIVYKKPLGGTEQLSVSDEREVLDLLKYLRCAIPFADQFGFSVQGEERCLYTHAGKYQADIFAREVLHMEGDAFRELLDANESRFVPWSDAQRISLYVAPLRIYASSRITAVGVYVFSYASLVSSLKNALPQGYTLCELYAPDGTLIYCCPTRSPGKQSEGEHEILYADGQRCLVGRAIGAKGYRSVVYVPEIVLSQNISEYSALVKAFIWCAVAFCVALLIMLVAVNYLPIARLMQNISRHHMQPQEQDELSSIYDAFSRQVDENHRMELRMNQQRMTLTDYAYDRLLSGAKLSQQDISILKDQAPWHLVVCANLEDIADIDVILEQNAVNSLVYAVEMYTAGYLVLICQCTDDSDRARSETLNRALCLLGNAPAGSSALISDLTMLQKAFQEAAYMLATLGRAKPSPERKTSLEFCNTLDNTYSQLIRYVDEHFRDPTFGVSSTAEYLGISEYSTGKLLRNVYGANFRRIINSKRVEYAKNMLITTDESIAHICKQAGFMSTSYFIKVFRELESITPSQYRNASNKS